jgi:anaerobic selenocysteine-containing dehydrogenase
MKLSEAILLGAMMSPQAFRALFRDDGACALGAALLAVGPASEQSVHSVFKRWPWAVTVSADCPGCGHSCPVFGVITHLNDSHRWTREQIAGWVASIEPAEAWAPEEVPEAAWPDDAGVVIRQDRRTWLVQLNGE